MCPALWRGARGRSHIPALTQAAWGTLRRMPSALPMAQAQPPLPGGPLGFYSVFLPAHTCPQAQVPSCKSQTEAAQASTLASASRQPRAGPSSAGKPKC